MGKHKKTRSSHQPSVDRKFEIESAARTLLEAEKIKQDKGLFAGAKKELRKQQSAMKKAVK